MEDIEKINILDLVQRPKVSENLDEIIEMISTLIKKVMHMKKMEVSFQNR